MKKVFYEKPTTETLVVRFEGVICESNGIGTSGSAGGIGEGEEYELG